MINIKLKLAENQTFETNRLLLRKITLEDAADLFEFGKDPEVARYVSWKPHENLEATKEVIANFFIPNGLMTWGIVEKESARLIGTIDFRVRADRLAEFGWMLNKNYWGRGFMPEAAKVLLDFCFKTLELQVVQAKHMSENSKSGRVMAKLGLRRLGQTYEIFDKFDQPLLCDYWALTRNEYFDDLAAE